MTHVGLIGLYGDSLQTEEITNGKMLSTGGIFFAHLRSDYNRNHFSTLSIATVDIHL